MFPILQIGGFAIQTPGLVLLIGIWLGLTMAERYSHLADIRANDLYNLTLLGLITGIVGARISFYIQHPDAFTGNFGSLLSLNPGLLDPWGGIGFGLIAALIYGQRNQLDLMATLDAITPALAVTALSFGFSNLASGLGYGAPTNLPWAIQLWGDLRHPSQIYEIIGASIIIWIVWPSETHKNTWKPGERFLAFLALSAGARLFLEGFRGDSLVWWGGIRMVQVVAWSILGISLLALKRISKGREKAQQ